MPNIEINHRTSFHRMRTMSQSSAASLQSGDTGVGSCSPPNITPNNTPTTTVNMGAMSGANFHHGGQMVATMNKMQHPNQSPPNMVSQTQSWNLFRMYKILQFRRCYPPPKSYH